VNTSYCRTTRATGDWVSGFNLWTAKDDYCLVQFCPFLSIGDRTSWAICGSSAAGTAGFADQTVSGFCVAFFNNSFAAMNQASASLVYLVSPAKVEFTQFTFIANQYYWLFGHNGGHTVYVHLQDSVIQSLSDRKHSDVIVNFVRVKAIALESWDAVKCPKPTETFTELSAYYGARRHLLDVGPALFFVILPS
jgi:hypothetical protein